MSIEFLKENLCAFGRLEIVKEGSVFTVLITGEGLSRWETVNKIQEWVLKYAGDKYPIIEALKNDEHFFCLVLRPPSPQSSKEVPKEAATKINFETVSDIIFEAAISKVFDNNEIVKPSMEYYIEKGKVNGQFLISLLKLMRWVEKKTIEAANEAGAGWNKGDQEEFGDMVEIFDELLESHEKWHETLADNRTREQFIEELKSKYRISKK